MLLPSAAVAEVKRQLTDATNQMHRQAVQATRDFWLSYAKSTRSTASYRAALEDYMDAGLMSASGNILYRRPGGHPSGIDSARLREQLYDLLESVADKPRRLTVAEVAAAFPKATSRTTAWHPGIRLNGRTLTFGAGENKDVRDEFASHPVGGALYRALAQVAWTRNSGSYSWGSDEYLMDAARSD